MLEVVLEPMKLSVMISWSIRITLGLSVNPFVIPGSRCSGIRGKLNKDSKSECHTCARQYTDKAEGFYT